MINTWTHVVAVFNNGDTTRNKIYVNGVSVPLSRPAGSNDTCNSRSATSVANISGWPNDTGYRFGTRIDDVSIYRGELDPAIIAGHHKAGRG